MHVNVHVNDYVHVNDNVRAEREVWTHFVDVDVDVVVLVDVDGCCRRPARRPCRHSKISLVAQRLGRCKPMK